MATIRTDVFKKYKNTYLRTEFYNQQMVLHWAQEDSLDNEKVCKNTVLYV